MRPAWLVAAVLAVTGLGACVPGFAGGSSPSRQPTGAAAQRALVLGGGGPTGYAWEAGILKGLQDAAIDLTAVDLIVGTSAGSVLGTQIRTGKAVQDLYAAQLAPPTGSPLAGRSPASQQYLQDTYRMWQTLVGDPAKMRIEVGQRALQAPNPIPETAQKNRWRAVLGLEGWPVGTLKLTAVDVYDGTTRLFDRSQDAPIEAAVSASTAIPGLQAPITVGDHRYMDGGVAGAHIDAAQGYGVVVAVVTGGTAPARQEIRPLREAGSRVALIAPDQESAAAVGTDRFAVSHVKPSAEAGLRQAAAVADEVRAAWSGTVPR